jgi:phosphomannomutase
MINQAIYRAYDIRGHSERDLSPTIAYKIGFCFAKLNIKDNNLICVGRDGRLSSPNLCSGLINGIRDAGGKVIYIGITSTPTLYFADQKFSPCCSIMVTGSHNPKDDNGFKMLKNGLPFFGKMIQELSKEITNKHWEKVNPLKDVSDIKEIDLTDEYITRLLDGAIIDSDLKIGFDPACGSAARITKLLCNRLPCTSIVINGEIDGNFPAHDPDPTVEKNLDQLKNLVKTEGLDVGIGFDGDGDRIGIITNKGNMVFGDQLLCLYAKSVLKNYPKGKIIADVKASGVFFDYVTELGGQAIMWKTGHSFIKAKMKEENSLLAGEMSGHIFFADKYYGFDDALYAAVRLIEIMSTEDSTIDEMIEMLPKAYNTPEIRIMLDDTMKFQIIDKIKRQLLSEGKIFNDIDGLRVTTDQGWWLLRASNTQAAIIARCESSSPESLELLKQNLKNILFQHGIDIEL